ncbi:MAG: threonylcarbamoyl-AMP synthase [Candidatus Adiutrix sp.]|jgi:tRNA threonylcarbamoyl adenosine modification protein (Sua5/YciO/YrdC/YwlC family)|nr:threonylcarbamoyl-AMP synthase [Candidatus Adiutrix sp.]
MIININPDNPQKRLIEKVAEILKKGGLVIYPTDTQYGLGCDLSQRKAIEKIYQLKQRSRKTPFSFVCADLTHIAEYAKVSDFAYRTMRRLLPGPYTFILNATKLVPQLMLTKRDECGIRVPNHPIAIELVKTLGRPIINTSADMTAEDQAAPGEDRLPPAFFDSQSFAAMFKTQVDVVIDGGPVPCRPSTVVSLVDDEPEVLRQGLGPWPA